MASQLLTRYILASLWVRILIFIIFYFIILKLHFFDVECMGGVSSKNAAQKFFYTREIYDKERESAKDLTKELAKELEKGSKNTAPTFDRNLAKWGNLTMNILSPNIPFFYNDIYFWFLGKPRDYFLPDNSALVLNAKEKAELLNKIIKRFHDINFQNDSSTIDSLNRPIIIKNCTQMQEIELENFNENFRQRQLKLSSVFKKAINHKIVQIRLETQNEIFILRNQNSELQRTVIQQVAESKSQLELIENIRKSFEQQLNEKNHLINQLQEEKLELTKNLLNLQLKNEQLINQIKALELERSYDREIKSLQRDVDRLLVERNTAKIDDLHTMGIPPASPKSF